MIEIDYILIYKCTNFTEGHNYVTLASVYMYTVHFMESRSEGIDHTKLRGKHPESNASKTNSKNLRKFSAVVPLTSRNK